MREFGEKVSAEIKTEIETNVAAVKKAAEGEDVSAIKSATDALGQVIQKIGASVYENPAADEGEAAEGTSSENPDVVEGEVKE